jgi:ribonuclease HI
MIKFNIEKDILIPFEVSKAKANTFVLQNYLVKEGKIVEINREDREVDTSNRAEMSGLLAALEVARTKSASDVNKVIVTNSAYLSDAINNDYLSSWQKNGWKNFSGSEIKNQDLWEQIIVSMSSTPNCSIVHRKSDKLIRELSDKFNKMVAAKKLPSR